MEAKSFFFTIFIIILEWNSQSKSYLILSKIGRKTHSLLATRSYLVKVFRFQRKTLLFSFGFFFPIIIIFFLTDFVHAISRKQLDEFSWNFQDLCIITWTLCVFFLFWWRHFRSEILPILWILKGCVVQSFSEKWVEIEIWNSQAW